MNENKKMVLALVILLVAVGLGIFLWNRKHNKEGYKKCICSSSMDKRECQDGDEVQQLYDENILTEFTKLKSPGWTQVSPGDIDYPISEGCPWPDESNKPKWQAWDFTDFVG